MLPFTLKQIHQQGAHVDGNSMAVKYDNTDFGMSLEELALKGKHNVYNSMAAAITGSVLRLRKDVIRESLMDFKGVEHRLETVMKVNEIEFINDSKATNVNSAWYALESMNKPVIWIAGGTDKGNDYSELYDLVKHKVKALICLTADSANLHKAFDGMIETIVDCRSMAEAVTVSHKLSKPGDAVLLSPACASFDLFENYEDRGNQFKKYVKEL
jgi:UDP-N-acetylmuramoylalanine--D-glutamate ligase